MKYSNKEDERPAMQFYVWDWLGCPELRRCSVAARGLWIDILCEMWLSKPRGTFITGDNRGISRRFGIVTEQYNRLITELEKNKVFSRLPDGTIYCRRMYRIGEELRQITETKSKAGKAGMAKRWHNTPVTDGDNRPITNITPPTPTPTPTPSPKEIHHARHGKRSVQKLPLEEILQNFKIETDSLLSENFSDINIAAELQRMQMWIRANYKTQKVHRKKDWKRFALNWLNKTQGRMQFRKVDKQTEGDGWEAAMKRTET